MKEYLIKLDGEYTILTPGMIRIAILELGRKYKIRPSTFQSVTVQDVSEMPWELYERGEK